MRGTAAFVSLPNNGANRERVPQSRRRAASGGRGGGGRESGVRCRKWRLPRQWGAGGRASADGAEPEVGARPPSPGLGNRRGGGVGVGARLPSVPGAGLPLPGSEALDTVMEQGGMGLTEKRGVFG